MPVILPAPDLPSGRRSALVIATGKYTDERLAALRSPGRDAQELASVLGDRQIGGFAARVALDREIHQLRVSIEEFLATRKREETVVLYLSCHGVLSARRKLYFATVDTRQDRLAATGLEARWLIELLDQCEARRQVVLLDCCFSGAFALTKAGKGAQDVGLEHDFGVEEGRGRIVLTASRATEYSFEGEALGDGSPAASVFTAALVEGLRTGIADGDGDGLVSVSDLYGFVYARVRASGAAQTPQRWMYGAEGEVTLARSPAGRVVEPEPLSHEIRALLESGSPRGRLAGVAELGDWLAEEDPRRTSAARLALEEIAARDNPQVAEAARRLLADAAGAVSLDASRSENDDSSDPLATAGVWGPPVYRQGRAKTETEGRPGAPDTVLIKQQPRTPLHLFWLIDCSGSMAGSKMSELNFAIREVIPGLRQMMKYATVQMFMRIMVYSDGARWIDNKPTPIEQYSHRDLQAGGVTDMGAAFRLVAHELQVPPMPERCIPPVVILTTDGAPTDDWRQGLRALDASAWGPKAQRLAFAIGYDADRNVLKEFLANPELEPFSTTRPDSISDLFASIRYLEETIDDPDDDVW